MERVVWALFKILTSDYYELITGSISVRSDAISITTLYMFEGTLRAEPLSYIKSSF